MADQAQTKRTITRVRRCLNEVRRRWAAHSPASPLRLCDRLDDDGRSLTISEFAFEFVRGHHKQRSG